MKDNEETEEVGKKRLVNMGRRNWGLNKKNPLSLPD